MSYSQLYNSTLRRYFDNWQNWGVEFKPKNIPRSNQPLEMKIKHNGQWRSILLRSLENEDSLAGLELGFFAIDEAYSVKEASIKIVNARVRASEQPRNQILYTTTLADKSSWMYERFVEKHDADYMDVIYAPTESNMMNLPEGFVAAQVVGMSGDGIPSYGDGGMGKPKHNLCLLCVQQR